MLVSALLCDHQEQINDMYRRSGDLGLETCLVCLTVHLWLLLIVFCDSQKQMKELCGHLMDMVW